MPTIGIISGSHREEGQSHKIANHIKEMAEKDHGGVTAQVIDISTLPLWDEGMWGKDGLKDKWATVWSPISETLKACDAVVIISPEYSGIATPKITNFMLLAGNAELGHKPGMLVSVSASRGGAYPISQLRSFGTKNNHLCWVPDHVIIRNVSDYLKDVTEGKENYTSKMMTYALTLLLDYAEALASVRAKGHIDFETYPFGM